MSIEDLFIENTVQYIARAFDPMRAVANRQTAPSGGVGEGLTGSSLLARDMRQRILGQRNPFV
jgi:hypothetical protein